jgi:hypothetical protein
MEVAMTEIQQAPYHSLIASDRIEGTVVRRHNGEKIGKIERLMIDKVSGTIAYAVMSFGGLFGLGHKHYPIPWPFLKYNRSLDAYESDIPDEELAKMQSFEKMDFGNRADQEALYAHYGFGPYWGTM